jgi:hypothetical protein
VPAAKDSRAGTVSIVRRDRSLIMIDLSAPVKSRC